MKSKIMALIVMCLMLANCIPVFANTDGTNIIEGIDIVNELQEYEETIINDINYTLSSENVRQFSIEDIDYSKIVTLYDIDKMFLNDNLNNEKMQEYISESNYSYIVPLYDNEKTVLVSLIKVKPITDEERASLSDETLESIEKTVGQWIVGSIVVKDSIVDYRADLEKALNENNIKNSNVYFTNCCLLVNLIAVVCNDNSNNAIIKILDQTNENEDTEELLLDKNILHSYDEMKKFVESTIVENNDANDTEEMEYFGMGIDSNIQDDTEKLNGNIFFISAISIVVVIAIAVTVVCVVNKKKKAKNIES